MTASCFGGPNDLVTDNSRFLQRGRECAAKPPARKMLITTTGQIFLLFFCARNFQSLLLAGPAALTCLKAKFSEKRISFAQMCRHRGAKGPHLLCAAAMLKSVLVTGLSAAFARWQAAARVAPGQQLFARDQNALSCHDQTLGAASGRAAAFSGSGVSYISG